MRRSTEKDPDGARRVAAVLSVGSWALLCVLAFAGATTWGVPVAFSSAASSPASPGTSSGNLAAVLVYAQDPPPLAHTGGFGEPTCHECHFGSPLDPPEGSLAVQVLAAGAADRGTFDGSGGSRDGGDGPLGEGVRRIRVVLREEGMERAGFQLAARFATGSEAGEQAGELRAVDDRVSVVTDPGTGVQYAQHARDGTSLTSPGTVTWELAWVPPQVGEVVFHVAANAANYDDSEFGDLVYTAEENLELVRRANTGRVAGVEVGLLAREMARRVIAVTTSETSSFLDPSTRR